MVYPELEGSAPLIVAIRFADFVRPRALTGDRESRGNDDDLPDHHKCFPLIIRNFFGIAPILSGLGLPKRQKLRGFRSSALHATSASFRSVYQRTEIIVPSY